MALHTYRNAQFEQKISTDKLNVPRAYKYQKLSKNRWSNKK